MEADDGDCKGDGRMAGFGPYLCAGYFRTQVHLGGPGGKVSEDSKHLHPHPLPHDDAVHTTHRHRAVKVQASGLLHFVSCMLHGRGRDCRFF